MSIVDQIKQEIFNFYCSDCKHFMKYLLSLTKSGRLVRLVTTNDFWCPESSARLLRCARA